ncbi:hypothetical protein HLK59_02815 [Streptomyces sp. S3(2020)]|uniref:hypothetical protein n=1 Tax=Streptomyces sp. S3(2020) TaxID=2732044 RepID=UPI001487C5C4|nr:hypothetical protein [Streptomyces sp. S3(2020)]NNN29300.1 hypothetical protein [Streptomyces sp. S3(2020)]
MLVSAVATVVPLTRFSRLEDVRRRLEQSRAAGQNQFRWVRSVDMQELDGTQRTFVFVPVLMAAGAALSGLAMVIQELAGATARPGAERRPAGRLAALTAPELGPRDTKSVLEARPAVTPARTGRRATAAAGAVQLAAQDLWETCRRSTAALNDEATLSRLDDGVYSAVIRPALPSHDVMRLRGCVEDASTNRTTATVLGEGQAHSRR